MATKKDPSFSRLLSTLARSQGLDNAAYQVIQELINQTQQFKDLHDTTQADQNNQITTILTQVDGGKSQKAYSFITVLNETTDLPNSVQLLAGVNITFDTSVANKLTISATGASGLIPHHATHETGGSDALANLSAAILLSGILPDARLSSNIPRLNANNVFTGIINEFTQALNLRASASAGVDQRLWQIFASGNSFLYLSTLTDAGVVITADIIAITRAGDVAVKGQFDAASLNATQLTRGTLPDARLSANIPRLNAINTFTATNIFTGQTTFQSANAPVLIFNVVTNAVDAKIWRVINYSGDSWLRFETLNDALSTVQTTPFLMNRNGNCQMSANVQVLGGIIQSGTTPNTFTSSVEAGVRLNIRNTGAAANQRLWSLLAYTDGSLYFQALDDGSGFQSNSGWLSRSGNLAFMGGMYEHNRATAMGEWIDFTPTLAASAGTVTLNTNYCCSYTLIGKTMILNIFWDITLSAAPSQVTFTLPSPYVAKYYQSAMIVPEANNAMGVIQVTGGGSTVYLLAGNVYGSGAWPTGANRIVTSFAFQIQ